MQPPNYNANVGDMAGSGAINSPHAKILNIVFGNRTRLNKVLTSNPTDTSNVFYGRKELIKAIKKRLSTDNPIVLYGMGGIGKTQIAKKIYYSNRKYKYIGWVNYSGNMLSSIVREFEFSSGIIFDEKADEKQKFKVIESFINNNSKSTLLMIDNVNHTIDEDNTINLVRGLNCTILITSRCKLINNEDQNILIGFLDEHESVKLFKAYYKIEYNEAIIKAIIKLAGSHTMTIELLSKTAQSARIKLTNFYNTLLNHKFDLTGIKESITTNWNNEETEALLIEHLQKVFSISDLPDIERDILGKLSLFLVEPMSLNDTKEILELDKLSDVDKLEKKGWISINKSAEGKEFVQMHSVIKAMVEKQYQPVADECLYIVRNLAQKLEWGDKEYYKHVLPYLNPAEELFNNLGSVCKEEIGLLANNIAKVYKDKGEYNNALEFFEKSLDILEKLLGNFHPYTGTTYNNIAGIFRAKGEYDKALEYYNKALDIYLNIHGDMHPFTGTTYNNIASVYDDKGEYEKALEYYYKDLDIREKLLGKLHPSTGTTYNNIAGVYADKGEYDKALEYYNKALDIREKLLGELHPSTGTTYNNIAGVFKDKGEYDKALEYYYKALDIYIKVHGELHPDTGTTYNNIALIFNAQGEYDKALEYYRKALNIRENLLGEFHPSTGTTYNNIAMVYEDKGEYNKALGFYKKALDIFKSKLGDSHPKTKIVSANMKGLEDKILQNNN